MEKQGRETARAVVEAVEKQTKGTARAVVEAMTRVAEAMEVCDCVGEEMVVAAAPRRGLTRAPSLRHPAKRPVLLLVRFRPSPAAPSLWPSTSPPPEPAAALALALVLAGPLRLFCPQLAEPVAARQGRAGPKTMLATT